MTLYLGDKQIAGTLKGEINNPYSLLESKYSELEITNTSWLKSQGQWNTKAMYPSAWEKIVSLQKTLFYVWLDENDLFSDDKYHTFGTLTTNPKVGDKVYQVIEGDIDEVYYNAGDLRGEILEIIGNQYKIRDYASTIGYTPIITRHNEKDVVIPFAKKSTETYTDYDFVINEDDETFRLPLKTKTSFVIDEGEENGIKYRTWNNGYCEQEGVADNGTDARSTYWTITLPKKYNNTKYTINYTTSRSGSGNYIGSIGIDATNLNPNTFRMGFYGQGTSDFARYCYWKTSGYLASDQYTPQNLYYYVGDTVQNASLIDVAQITSALSNKVDINSKVIDGQFIAKALVLSTTKALGTYTLDLYDYLPKDGYTYEVWLTGTNYSSGSSYCRYHIYTDVFNAELPQSTELKYCWITHTGTNSREGCFLIKVPVKRYVYEILAGVALNDRYVPLTAMGYRRIGTNE